LLTNNLSLSDLIKNSLLIITSSLILIAIDPPLALVVHVCQVLWAQRGAEWEGITLVLRPGMAVVAFYERGGWRASTGGNQRINKYSTNNILYLVFKLHRYNIH
jgi:hypothetical protein